MALYIVQYIIVVAVVYTCIVLMVWAGCLEKKLPRFVVSFMQYDTYLNFLQLFFQVWIIGYQDLSCTTYSDFATECIQTFFRNRQQPKCCVQTVVTLSLNLAIFGKKIEYCDMHTGEKQTFLVIFAQLCIYQLCCGCTSIVA